MPDLRVALEEKLHCENGARARVVVKSLMLALGLILCLLIGFYSMPANWIRLWSDLFDAKLADLQEDVPPPWSDVSRP